LKFRLLTVAEGFRPSYTEKHVEPETGPVSIRLKPHDLDHRDPKRVLLGRVVNENGDPVARAVVEPFGFALPNGTQFGGTDDKGIDPLAVSDGDGRFRLGVGEDRLGVLLNVKAPYLAPVRLKPLAAGPDRHTIHLGVGVTVSGRVVKDGKPLPGLTLGMVQKSRNSETFVGEFQFATDADGWFHFVNIPPGDDFYLYGIMDSFKAHGALAARPVTTAEHGSTIELGTIEVQPGLTVSGRVVLSDDKPLPPHTRVLLGSEEAWDVQIVEAAPDGTFLFTSVPPGPYDLSANLRAYHPSKRNRSLDLLNPFRLLGMVPADRTNLRILYESGEMERLDRDSSPAFWEEYRRRKEAPLEGVPAEKR
jgi:protocatechuate 3,4-dioxygenase beta subunit